MRALCALAGHAATLAARFATPGGGKLRRSLAARRGAIERIARWAHAARDPRRPLIWMHAPSVGEGLMARPVVALLRDRIPAAQFAYTFFSPSAESFARSLAVDVAEYLPFDTPAAARELLDALTPRVLVFSKLDVWPLLVAEARARGVPMALTSASVDAASSRMSWLARELLRDAYSSLDAVGTVHADDAERLQTLGVRPDRISVTGDVRYDQVWAQVGSVSRDADYVARLRSPRPTLVAGSTWPSDEKHLLEAWPHVTRRTPEARLIMAAHEPSPSHTARVVAWASAANLRAAAFDQAEADTDLVVVDRVGVLLDLYALGRVAYVGGAFRSRRLHSVVEPAAHGAAVLFGPRGTSDRDAAALISAGGGFAVAGAEALADRITELFTNAAASADASARAKQVIVDGLGAAEKSAALVQRLLTR